MKRVLRFKGFLFFVTMLVALFVIHYSGCIAYAEGEGTWSQLQQLIDKADANSTIMLDRDYKAPSDDYSIYINKPITIDLNGHTIDGKMSEEKHLYIIFYVDNCHVTIKDDSSGAKGQIINGKIAVLVKNNGEFVLENGTIRSAQTAGVYVNGGKFTMNGGSISGSHVGVEDINYSTVEMTGGSITGNETGINLDSNSNIALRESPVIVDNIDKNKNLQNVRIKDSDGYHSTIAVSNKLSENAKIGVYFDNPFSGMDFLINNVNDYKLTKSDLDKFSIDNNESGYWITWLDFRNGQGKIVSPTEYLQLLIDNTNSGGTIMLDRDYEYNSEDGSISINKNITINLNGHTIERVKVGSIFNVKGSLTITDNKENKGEICGGTTCVLLIGSSCFTLKRGTLCGSEDASISAEDGATVIIDGGIITNAGGSGVYLDNSTLEMNGGRITENTYGLYVKGDSTIKVKGNPIIKDNFDKANNRLMNVYFFENGNSNIVVTGALSGTANIGVTIFDEDKIFAKADKSYNEGKLSESDINYFFSDDQDYEVRMDNDGNLRSCKVIIGIEVEIEGNLEYTGNEIKPKLIIKDVSTGEVYDDYFDITYSNNINAGKGTAVISEKIENPRTKIVEFTIYPKLVSINWSNDTLIYDGKSKAPKATVGNLATGDTCNVTVSGAKTDAGTGYIAVAEELSNSNYKLSGDEKCVYSIEPRQVKVSDIKGKDKTYDGKLTADFSYKDMKISNVLEDDDIFAEATGEFIDINAGDNKTISIDNIELTGDDKNNYVISDDGYQNVTTASIIPKEAVLSWGDTTFAYDGTPKAPKATVINLENDDVCTVTVSGEKTDAGTGYIAVAEELSDSNYKVAADEKCVYSIAPRQVKISGIKCKDKTYDGTFTADFSYNDMEISNVLEDDVVFAEANGKFIDKNAGENKTISIDDIVLIGKDKNNYIISDDGYQKETTAGITQKEAVLTWSDTTLTYDGKPKAPKATVGNLATGDTCTVTVSGEKIEAGTDYIAVAEKLSNPNYKLPQDNTVRFSIKNESINGAKVVLSKTSFTYNKKVQKPVVKTIGGKQLISGTDYTINWSNAQSKNVGTYKLTITGKGRYSGTIEATYKIVKAVNPLQLKAKAVTVKYTELNKKAQTLNISKVLITKKKGQGTITYKQVTKNKNITINKKTGKITLKKGLKKGKYKVKIKVTAAGNNNYKKSAKNVTLIITVK